MKEEKAYKLLAIQEGISNNEAKELIDAGLVSAKGQRIAVARAMMSAATKFNVQKLPRPSVILLVKNEEFQKKAIEEFKNCRVKKEYVAAVKGIVSEEFSVNEPIITLKNKGGAFSKISPNGKEAFSHVMPVMVAGKKSLVKVEIKTGRTHQIRVHLNHAGYGIVGDEKYAKNKSVRMYLHAYRIELLGYKFRSNLSSDFNRLGFEISRNFEI